jgi:hypothetical protein
MRRIITTLAVLAMAGIANASNTTNLFPNGDFESGGAGAWVEAGGPVNFSYPTQGGNPNGYGIIDATPGGWGIWVGGADTPLSLSSLGLTAGQTYTFVQDMELISGNSIGGLKVESWGPTAVISDSGDMRPASGTTSWQTYSFTYTIDPAATGLKIVPLWGPNSIVGYDNLGVVVPGPSPLSVSITNPISGAVLNSNFLVNAAATVYPGAVTNVGFYVDNTLAGNVTAAPFNFLASGVSAGAHALKAVASDSNGNSVTSSVVNITVTNAAPPIFGAYEPFNYPAGSFPNSTPCGGTGFTGNWVVPSGNATIVSGLSYPGLPTANNALQVANNGSSRSLATFSSTLSSGTAYVSFLMQGSGNSGGNWAGVFLQGDKAKSLFAGFLGGYSASQTSFGLGSVTSAGTAPTGGTAFGTTVALSNTTVHLVVLKLDFNTSGTNDTVSLWLDPPARTNSPGVTANATYSSFDVGNISGIGLNLQGGSPSFTIDEIRVGSSYADVVGANLHPTVPTTLALSVAPGAQVSWSAKNTNYYQPQKSSDGSSWTDLGGLLYGSAVTSVYDTPQSPYYQVLEIGPVNSEEVTDGGIEVDDGSGNAFYWTVGGSEPATKISSDAHSGTSCMFINVTNPIAAANTSFMQQNLAYASGNANPIVGGNSYSFSFWAKQVSSGPSYVQQYNVTWLDVNGAVVSAIGWSSFAGSNGAWTHISTGPVVAPATAVNALLQIQGITGAIANGFGGVLIDDVSLLTTTPTGPTDVLTPTVRAQAVFTGVVQAGGTNATAASGTITFITNGLPQSQGTLAAGAASSTAALVPSSYTLTAIYSGDATYIGSTNTLVVGGNFGSGPNTVRFASGQATVVMSGVSGKNYSVQRATNLTFTLGVSNFPAMTAPANGNVPVTDNFSDLGVVPKSAFYRLRYLP